MFYKTNREEQTYCTDLNYFVTKNLKMVISSIVVNNSRSVRDRIFVYK